MSPKVFVSHASEDKARFVIPFAKALRSRGVDAWVDEWEMLPGDSLVGKIFDDGFKDASAVIIVLSKTSMTKPWVREELNTAFVQRIEKGTKLIPIVLDSCDVPLALRSTVWQSVPDPTNFAECLDRVTDSIFGRSRKPPIGEHAPYLAESSLPVSGLSAADNLVLSTLYDEFVERGGVWVEPAPLTATLREKGLEAAVAADCLAVLEHMGYAESIEAFGAGAGLKHARIARRGVSAILGLCERDLLRGVGFAIVNDGLRRSDAIAESLGHPMQLINHALGLLEDSDHLILSREISPVKVVAMVKPTLRRVLDSQ